MPLRRPAAATADHPSRASRSRSSHPQLLLFAVQKTTQFEQWLASKFKPPLDEVRACRTAAGSRLVCRIAHQLRSTPFLLSRPRVLMCARHHLHRPRRHLPGRDERGRGGGAAHEGGGAPAGGGLRVGPHPPQVPAPPSGAGARGHVRPPMSFLNNTNRPPVAGSSRQLPPSCPPGKRRTPPSASASESRPPLLAPSQRCVLHTVCVFFTTAVHTIVVPTPLSRHNVDLRELPRRLRHGTG